MGIAFERLVEALQSHGFKVKMEGRDRARAQCPGHGGEDFNLCIAVGDQGVLVKDQAYDCPAGDIVAPLGLTVGDLFDKDGHATYDYGGGHRVTRRRTRDGKKIMQQNKPPVTSLYRHPLSMPIEESDVVVLVEGEKCVDSALHLGERCVTTWPQGADGVGQVDLAPLGGKTIRIIADNDEPGLRAAARLVSRLSGLATVQGVWVVPNEKESVDDLWVRGGSLEELVPAPPLEAPRDDRPRTVSLRKASDMKSRAMRFIWEDIFPMSCATIVGGTGGVGKSTLMLWMAGLLTKGTLKGDLLGQPSSVLYVSHEDSMEEVVLNRLDANGVDRERFYQLNIHSKKIRGDVLPDLPEDMPLIREAIEQTGARMLIIDPVTSTMGGDNDKVNDVRMVIDPLNALAAELGIAVFCITHFKKGGGKNEDMISGSRAYWDAARCVALFAKDEETGETIMTIAKGNAHAERGSYAYRQDTVEVMTDEGTMTRVGKVVWMGQTERTVSGVVNTDPEATERQGMTANEILEFFQAFPDRAMTTAQVEKEFTHIKRETVRQNLGRIAKRGLIEKPAYGVWRLAGGVTEASRARGGVTDVTPVTSYESVTPVTAVTSPARGVTTCRICGFPLSDRSIASGDDTHPSCDR